MGLIKMWLLFRHYCTSKIKLVPTSTCVWESNGRRLIKVEVTPQEETPPERMAATINDMLTQKIYKVIEDQGEALKKIGSHLSKLKGSKIKKHVHIEINEEEEDKEEWDDRDKADYKRNKGFEKLIMDTMIMKEKVEKMQLAFRKAQGMDDCLYNMGGLSSKVPITLPPKFKISYVENFDGTRILKNMLGDT